MAKDLFIPQLGQTVEQVTIVRWLVEDGAPVERGQDVLEVETDKAVFCVEATGKGYLHAGPYKSGDVVPVLEVVATIGKQDEAWVAPGRGDKETGRQGDKVTGRQGDTAPDTRHPTPGHLVTDTPGHLVTDTPGHLVTGSPGHLATGSPSRLFASPRARRLAAEKRVDLAAVTPTGGNGARVVERDVIAFLQALPRATPVAQKIAAVSGVDLRGMTGTGASGKITRGDVERSLGTPAPAASAAEAAPAPGAQPLAAEVLERVPLKGVRGIIAERMAASVHTTARVTLLMEVDASELVAMRERLKTKVAAAWGFAPGYNDLLAKIVASALRAFPYMNARLAGDAIERLGPVNLGMAVDTERGLLVPVIRDADRKSLRQLGAEFRERVERARAGRSLPDELSGGTFTITNLGMYDVDAFTPVINLPEAAILGVGRIARKPVVLDGSDAVVVRHMWTLSLVFDHRLVDGGPAARFLQHIKSLVEEPYLLLAE